MIKVSDIINDARCKSSWWLLNENCLVITSYIKKKLNIGNNKVIDKIKVCNLVSMIFDKFTVGINPPEDIVVKAKLKQSKSLTSIKVYKKITKTVEKK